MITISVESDEEQWATGTALANGAIGFGNWPFEIKRRYRAGVAAGVAAGGNAHAAGHGGGGSGGVTISGGSGVISGGTVGGGSVTVPDYFVCPLRACCATNPAAGHREGCGEEDG